MSTKNSHTALYVLNNITITLAIMSFVKNITEIDTTNNTKLCQNYGMSIRELNL